MPKKLVWDAQGEHFYQTGTKKGVLFPAASAGGYGAGVAWNGLTAVTESPSGAESNPVYADDIKYLDIRSAEEFGFTIEALSFPDEFYPCLGMKEVTPGIVINLQNRSAFGFSYVSTIGNDTAGTELGYKIHLIYGATVSPSEENYQTINENPEPTSMSWEATTVPVAATGHKPLARITIDSTKVDSAKLATFEAILYGSDEADARLPLPDEVFRLLKAA